MDQREANVVRRGKSRMTSRLAVPDMSRSRLNRLMIRMAVSVVIPTMLAVSCLVIRTVRRIPIGYLIPLP